MAPVSASEGSVVDNPLKPKKLRPHQTKALREMRNGCILNGGVGSGKSLVSVHYYKKTYNYTRDIYIFTTAKKRNDLEWEGEFANIAIGKHWGSSYKQVQLTVDSWNNIGKYSEIQNAFFIFDEQRLVGSGAWSKAFLKIAQHNDWVMLSATPADNWMDYATVFIANGFYKNRSDFTNQHVIYSRFSKYPKIERYVEEHKLEKARKRVLVDMPFEKPTTRIQYPVIVDHDKELLKRVWTDRWNIFEDEPIKDVAELFRVGRKLINQDPSRIKEILKLVEERKRVIIFYNFNYELEILREAMTKHSIPYSEWNGKKHEKILEGDRWVYLVQYTAGAEGWNCTTTDTTAFYSLNYSYKIFEQSMGRIDRMDTSYKDLYYYVLMSNSVIDKLIWKSLSRKKAFNQNKLGIDFGEKDVSHTEPPSTSTLEQKYSTLPQLGRP